MWLVALFYCVVDGIDPVFVEDQTAQIGFFIDNLRSEVVKVRNLLRFLIGSFLMFVCFWVWKNDLSNVNG